jgi:hypothetical protein
MRYTTQKLRPLHIKFDSYGAGDDVDFKYELLQLMSGSIRELKAAANDSFNNQQPDAFKRAVHKAKSTLSLIDDEEFTHVVEKFTDSIVHCETTSEVNGVVAFDKFNEISESIIDSLGREAERLRAQE